MQLQPATHLPGNSKLLGGEPRSQNPKLPSSSPWKVGDQLKAFFNSLSIGRKIGGGYALALSVAILGTTTGLMVGNYYEQKAESIAKRGAEIGRLLTELQVNVLQARSHQHQFIPLLKSPPTLQHEHAQFVYRISQIEALMNKAKSFEEIANLPGGADLLKSYDGVVDAYFKQAEAVLRQVNPSHLKPETLAIAQQRLLEFTGSNAAFKFDELSDNLTDVAEAAFAKADQAQQDLQRAHDTSQEIIALSILGSVLLASIMAIRTSQAIARPIQAVTQVAKTVTEESNFDLQAPVTSQDEIGVLATAFNRLIQKVKKLLEEQKEEAARQLIQSEKMSSLGRMMAGVAHEINNPINFVYGNLEHTNTYFEDLLDLLHAYETKASERDIQDKAEEIDLEFLKQDLPKTLQSMKVGADRARQIVLSLKNFSRLDETEVHPVDIHDCLDSTLLILNNRIKKGVTIHRNYGQLPQIEGFAGSLYQVFMNILSNAIDALDEQDLKGANSAKTANGTKPPAPSITITTERPDPDWIVVRIADNGPGIAPEHKARIFETFFTTKPVGIGTGLGLSISYQIVVEKHGGRLSCESELGQGTTFEITLPILHPVTCDLETEHPAIPVA